MERRTVVVGAAFAVAALVLAASVFLGPPAGTGDRVEDIGGIGAAVPTGVPDGGSGIPGMRAEDWTYRVLETVGDDKTRITLLSADQIVSRGQGVTHLTSPSFRIVTTEAAEVQTGTDAQGNPITERRVVGGRAMLLTADRAEMEMDGQDPQRGVFSGNVRVTLLATDAGPLVIDEDDPRFGIDTDIQRVYIDGDARFGLDTNEVRSDDPVHVTSAQADFYGIGLLLKYNTARERVEHLIVHEGRYLMFDPDAPKQASLTAVDESDTGTPEAAGGAGNTADNSGANNAADPTEPRGPSQFYRATFNDRIVVRDTDRALLEGDSLSILFSLGTEAVEPEPVRPAPGSEADTDQAPATSRLHDALPGFRIADANTGTDTTSGALAQLPAPPPPLNPNLVPPANRARSLYTTDPADGVVITWAGQLQLEPLDAKPERLVDDEDIAIALSGPDAYAQSMRDGEVSRVQAVELSYTLAGETVEARGGDGRPLTILATAAGHLAGEPGTRMTVDLQRGTAVIVGPGTLTQQPDDDGKQLVLAWTDRVDLDLYTTQRDVDDEQADEYREKSVRQTSGGTRVAGIRTATFVGDVTANHPDFDLAAGRLAVGFDEPDESRGIKNDPNNIQATGDVAVLARGDAEDETFNIQTQMLTIAIGRDTAGEPFAESMRAVGQVRLERPGSFMTCHRLDAALAPPTEALPDAADGDAPPASERYAQVRQIVAVGDVRAELEQDGRRIALAADHLLGDVEEDRLTLYATEEGTLAELVDVEEDRLLRGRHIVMDDRAEVARVEGPGTLAARMDDPDRPGNPEAVMNIRWADGMRFNNLSGRATFRGDVEAGSTRTADTTKLNCDELDVWFTPPAVAGDAAGEPVVVGEDAGGNDDALLDAGGRDIRRAVARGTVRFVAATREAAAPDQPTSRVMITGPELVFTNEPIDIDGTLTPVETVVVNGEGIMFIEDYTDQAGDDDEPVATSGGVAFSGKGQTAFRWTDRMELDALGNTARFDGNVRMDHDPTPKQRDNHDEMHMDCAQLVADMEDTGGLGVWLSDAAPQPEISVVTAEGPLRIIQAGKEIRGDHLRYTAAAQWAEVWADANRDVILTEAGRPAPVRCGRVLWDLANNRIEMRESRGGVTPAER